MRIVCAANTHRAARGPCRFAAVLLFFAPLVALVFVAVCPAVPVRGAPTGKSDQPATQPAKDSLLKGQFEFTPPAGWEEARSVRKPTSVKYVDASRKGQIVLQVLPTDAQTTPDAARKLIQQLKENHKKANQQMVMEPAVEPDERFALRIHEKFKPEKSPATLDAYYLYRKVGSRVLLTTSASFADDPDESKKIQSSGEAVAQSINFVKPGRSGGGRK